MLFLHLYSIQLKSLKNRFYKQSNKRKNINNNKKKLKVDNVDGNQSEKSCIDSDVADEIEYKFDPNYEDGLRNRFFSPQKLG